LEARRARLECRRSRLSHSVILVARAAAHANGTTHLTASLEGDASGKDHDFAVVGRVNAEELSARD
jgi:hypothetical protein